MSPKGEGSTNTAVEESQKDAAHRRALGEFVRGISGFLRHARRAASRARSSPCTDPTPGRRRPCRARSRRAPARSPPSCCVQKTLAAEFARLRKHYDAPPMPGK